MKNITILLFTLLCIIGCSTSPQKLGEKLAAKYIKDQLYVPKSYEAISTTVDTAYYAPGSDPEVIKHAKKIVDLESEINSKNMDMERAESEIHHAKSSMAIWSGSYSAFSRQEYANAKADFQKAQEKYDAAQKSITDIQTTIEEEKSTIISIVNSKSSPEPIGWLIQHKYRADSRSGVTSITMEIILASSDFSNVLFSVNSDDTDYMSYALKIADILDIELN